MSTPTFASFKPVRQPLAQQTVFPENPNIHPKSFHELKLLTQTRQDRQNIQEVSNPQELLLKHERQKRLDKEKGTAKKKTDFVLKKCLSQIGMEEHVDISSVEIEQNEKNIGMRNFGMNTDKKLISCKKNYVHVNRHKIDNVMTSRPSIMGPSLLKNKSFMQNLATESKENSGHSHRPSHGPFQGPYENKEVPIPISASEKYLQPFSQSNYVEGSFESSFSESEYSRNQAQLNFSRKLFRPIASTPKTIEQDTTCFADISLSSMARELCSSFGSEGVSSSEGEKGSRRGSVTGHRGSFQDYNRMKLEREKEKTKKRKELAIEDFIIISEIGQGKYGKVYMALHKETHFVCALKEIPKQKILEENLSETLIHEIKIQLYLDHPNIVKLYTFFHNEINIYLVMECCLEGHLLKQIKQRKIFEEDEILEIISDVFEAVAFLHCHGVIHRDLKPENIVIQNNVFKICDFGWAVYAKGDTRSTFCGTPLYVCPEVLKGNEYNEKADIWGLGVLTYELAYGRVPFPIWSQSDMIKIVKEPVYFPTWTNVSEKMQNLIKSMLNKDPRKRQGLNEIMASSLISEYVGVRLGLKSEVDGLF